MCLRCAFYIYSSSCTFVIQEFLKGTFTIVLFAHTFLVYFYILSTPPPARICIYIYTIHIIFFHKNRTHTKWKFIIINLTAYVWPAAPKKKLIQKLFLAATFWVHEKWTEKMLLRNVQGYVAAAHLVNAIKWTHTLAPPSHVVRFDVESFACARQRCPRFVWWHINDEASSSLSLHGRQVHCPHSYVCVCLCCRTPTRLKAYWKCKKKKS